MGTKSSMDEGRLYFHLYNFKAYMVSVPVEDRNKHMVLELFENIVKLKTNHSGQVIRLLQVEHCQL